jgi:hypothetical protein
MNPDVPLSLCCRSWHILGFQALLVFVQNKLTKLLRDVSLQQIIVLIFCQGVYLI